MLKNCFSGVIFVYSTKGWPQSFSRKDARLFYYCQTKVYPVRDKEDAALYTYEDLFESGLIVLPLLMETGQEEPFISMVYIKTQK